jgi:chemotaxis protein MotB
MQRLQQLKERVEKAIDASPAMNPFKSQIKLDITPEGLRIQILDELNRPMFDLGSARLKDYTRTILREIAKLLNEVDHKITLSGHTDAKPYASGERAYSNWELSADRANASRRELIAGGLADRKILRVVGLSSAVPFNADDPFDPANRRISIIVTNRKTEQLITSDGKSEEGLPAAPAPPAPRSEPYSDPEPKATQNSAVTSDSWPARR